MTRAETRGDALLLVAHGTTDAAGIAEIETLTALVAGLLPEAIVEICFLEIARPTILEGFQRLVARGIERVTVMPLLLFAAAHARRDIPAAVERARAAHPEWEIRLAPHLGCHPALVELSALRFEQAISAAGATSSLVSAAETLLVLVGRGSYEPEANAELASFARLRFERTPVGRYEVCYLSMAEPRVERAFELVAQLPLARVVVQPHLLFRGALFDRLYEAVVRQNVRGGKQAWLAAEHLGAHTLLAETILDRAGFGIDHLPGQFRAELLNSPSQPAAEDV
jgi:sirohydrochlorin ferrochelatase